MDIKFIALKTIVCLHTLFIIFVVTTPFLNINYFLMLHTIFIPFMVGHWLTNNNTCVLTVVEKGLRKQLDDKFDEDECFTCKLIEPVYDFKKNYEQFSTFIYILTFTLWLISSYKLYSKCKTGQINSWKDMFIL